MYCKIYWTPWLLCCHGHIKNLIPLLCFTGVTESFPDGAPKYQCPDAFPRHGFNAKPVNDVLPYEITASREVYAPEQEIDSKY